MFCVPSPGRTWWSNCCAFRLYVLSCIGSFTIECKPKHTHIHCGSFLTADKGIFYIHIMRNILLAPLTFFSTSLVRLIISELVLCASKCPMFTNKLIQSVYLVASCYAALTVNSKYIRTLGKRPYFGRYWEINARIRWVFSIHRRSLFVRCKLQRKIKKTFITRQCLIKTKYLVSFYKSIHLKKQIQPIICMKKQIKQTKIQHKNK